MHDMLKILMLEDDPLDAELAERQLRKAAMHTQVTRVETEAQFRRALHELRPDVIFADYSLPQFDGRRALQISVQEAPDTPFIFVSGTIGEEWAIESLQRGAIDYVLKTNLARLVPSVERALREMSLRAARRQAEQMLREIVETSQDWIWQLNAAGCFMFSSPAVTAILGYRPEDILGRHYSDFLHETDATAAASLLPSDRNILRGVAARWRHREGDVVWLERNAIRLSDTAGQLIGYRGTDRDVTERRKSEERIRRLSRVHQMLSAVNSAIVRTPRRSDLLQQACRIAVQEGDYLWASVQVVSNGVVRPVHWAGAHDEHFDHSGVVLKPGSKNDLGMVVQALLSREVVICNDLENDSQPVLFREQYLKQGFRSMAALPLLVNGNPIAAIVLASGERSAFDASEIEALKDVSSNIGFALKYFDQEDALHFLSYFDQLTGLRRRTLFCEYLTRRLEARGPEAPPITVAVLDVQRLGQINDAYGWATGDRLLSYIADQMKERFKDEEAIAHFGGGTFAVAFTEEINLLETARLHRTIAAIGNKPLSVDGRELRPALRAGIAYLPDDNDTAAGVVQAAEAALSRARETGEKYQLYSVIDKKRSEDRLAIESRLTGALARSEYLVLYQPKIDIATGRVDGAEALLRWRDPQRGMISPQEFIPLLESTGEIVEVGQWVLEQAARDCQTWMQMGLQSIRIAVNVSPVQMRRRNFVERVQALVSDWSTPKAGLDLEITESVLMHDLESSAGVLQRLRDAGLRIAIDDFGTGYSSLRHLAKLPADTLKIDRSFIQRISTDADDLTIVSTIISLAHSFRMTCVAEGVETREQLNVLKLLKCDAAQGYFYSRPLPAEDLPEFILRLQADVK